MNRSLGLALLSLTLVCGVGAEEFPFPEAAVNDSAVRSQALTELARQTVAAYRPNDPDQYLDNLFRLQIVSGQYGDSLKTIATLRERLRASHPERAGWVNVQYEIYSRARMRVDSAKQPFEQAYQQAFRETFARLDDRTSALVVRALTEIDPADSQQDLESDLDKQKGKQSIALTDAVKLVADYQVAEAYRAFARLDPPLIVEDDGRRYIAEKDIAVKTPDGATICTWLVRPRRASGRLPTLLNFTIYVDPNDNTNNLRQTASNGYAGVEGFTRGKACSPDKPVPYEYDGADAAALIDWITAQPWSDGRVGMYGGSYEGFTQWATAKHMPKGLKAMMTGAPAAPGVDVPMEGNVFWNFVYPWPLYTTNAKGADDATYNDRARWQRLNRSWYVSGRAYRDLDKIDGTPNPIFDQWIAHPGYDSYWQKLIPYRDEFARINIPVLQTAGYYYGGPGAAVYYLSQHYKYNPKAEHYLLIGPYHHIGAQFGVIGLVGNVYDSLAGMQLDEVAKIDITEIRYQWFDFIFKHGPRPGLLADRVNYQVTGANVWKHAPSLAAMADQRLRLHFSSARTGETYSLTEQKPSEDSYVTLTVNLADRSDVDRKAPGGGVVDTAVDPWSGLEFVSDPLPSPTEMSGLFSGHLDFVSNKKDFDFEVDLYEQTPKGEYVQLTSYWTRASYAGDRLQRQLLTPGKRQHLDFEDIRLMSRRLQAGSRVVVVLSVIKESGRQINYGTGKDVSDETIQDAGDRVQIRWYGDSCLDLPVVK